MKKILIDEKLETNPDIDFSFDEKYIVTSGKKSKDLKIYDITKNDKININKINSHS